MTTMHLLFGIPVGLALSAAAGLRVFVPLLLTGVAAPLGSLTLTPEMAWIGSRGAPDLRGMLAPCLAVSRGPLVRLRFACLALCLLRKGAQVRRAEGHKH